MLDYKTRVKGGISMKSDEQKTPISTLPADIQKLIADLRREAKRYRQLYQQAIGKPTQSK